MKTVIPMPPFEPPPKKKIEELINNSEVEERDDAGRRSYNNAQTRDWNNEAENGTRPDLKPGREEKKEKFGY